MGLVVSAVDICVFLSLTSSLIALLTVSNGIVIVILAAACAQGLMSMRNINHLKPFLNWFEVSKLLGGIAGLVAITYFRFYSFYSHQVIIAILGINIGEAILSDYLNGAYCNAVAGFLLSLTMPRAIDDIRPVGNLFLFPLSKSWILCYTSWNAAFSYGYNYSLSTRLILVSAIIVSYAIHHDVWLCARTYGLVINMSLRLSEASYLYKPNLSVVTTSDNKHSPCIRQLWGICNCIMIMLFA